MISAASLPSRGRKTIQHPLKRKLMTVSCIGFASPMARLVAAIFFTGLFAMTFCAMGDDNDGKITFTKRYTAPTRFNLLRESESDLTSKQDAGGKVTKTHQVVRSVLQADVSIESVNEQGRPRTLVFAFDKSCGDTIKADGAETQVHPSGLAGVKLTATRKGELWDISVDKTLEG